MKLANFEHVRNVVEKQLLDFTSCYGVYYKTDYFYTESRIELTFASGPLERPTTWIIRINNGDTESSLIRELSKIFDAVRSHLGLRSKTPSGMLPEIKNVIFNDPATIVIWADGTKTVVKCQENDIYSEETGLAMAIAKKALGNRGNFNNVFKKWTYEHDVERISYGSPCVTPADRERAKRAMEHLAALRNLKGRGLL